jgi:hypothetical protein
MSNQIGKTHWVLDSTGSITTAPVYITAIQWAGVAGSEIGAGDICELLDKVSGTRIFYRKAAEATSGEHQGFPGGIRVDGLYLNTLSSGQVIISLKTA